MNFSYIFIGLLLITIIVVPIIIVYTSKTKKQYQNQCNTNIDCPSNYICQTDPDYNIKVCMPSDKKNCGVDPSNLKACNPDPTIKKPNSPTFTCDKCEQQLKSECLRVSWGTLTIITPGSKYTENSIYPVNYTSKKSSNKGQDMLAKILKVNTNGGVKSLKIFNPGNNYTVNDELTIYGGDNKCTVKLTGEYKPFNWSEKGQIKVIPETEWGWCLPPIKQTDACNKYTSDTVLMKIGNFYEWRCICKNPDMFDHITSDAGSNCTDQQACGYPNNGELYVPENPVKKCTRNSDCNDGLCCTLDWPGNDGKGNCEDPSPGPSPSPSLSDKVCFTPWEKHQQTDPREGICKCNKNLKYIGNTTSSSDYSKLCVNDSCSPGTSSAGKGCRCPNGYIRCSKNLKNSDILPQYTKYCEEDRCLKDLCLPYGHYDPHTKQCVCNTQKYANNDPTLYKYDKNCTIRPDSTYTNSRVISLCNPGHCEQRGTCFTQPESPGSPFLQEFCDCNCPHCQGPYCKDTEFDNQQDCEKAKSTWVPAEAGCTFIPGNEQRPYCFGEANKLDINQRCNKNEDCCSGKCWGNFLTGYYCS